MRGIIILIIILIITTTIIVHLSSLSKPQLFAKCLNVTLGDSPGPQGGFSHVPAHARFCARTCPMYAKCT